MFVSCLSVWLVKVAAIFKDDSLKWGTAFHCELCNSFAKSNCFASDYDSLTVAFPSGQQLC